MKILYVEDDDSDFDLAQRCFHDLGMYIVRSRSGQEAIDMSCGGIDAVLIDYFLPDMPGVDVALSIRESNPHIPMAIISNLMYPPDMSGLEDVEFIRKSSSGLDAFSVQVIRFLLKRLRTITMSIDEV
jgi:CheY-like chemotaxis protein